MIQYRAITGDSLQARHCADRMLLFGDIHRRQLAARGVSEERLVVCGAPHLDSRPRQMGRPDAQLQEQLGLRPGERWVLVATSGPGHRISMPHHEVVVANVARLSQALPDVPIVIKLHRKDQVEHYAQALKDCASARYWVIADGTAGYPRQIYSWLQGCSVLLTGASTTAQEAMLLNVPVITMDFNDEIHGVDFIDAGATLHVRSGEELVSGVRAMLEAGGPPAETQRRIDALLKESFHALDGRAAQRCAAAVGDLAGLEH
ncbi:MAG: hypothetical protein DWQ37_15555 [Planctomycetota bacterium]|nr:MAG: hypothetical protein DWQ37_15555 [Planctomycetota bacterium]